MDSHAPTTGAGPEQRYHDAMTKEQEMHMCAVRTQADAHHASPPHAALAGTPLLAFLHVDGRPSFAMHAGASPPADAPLELAYSNPALQSADGLLARVTGLPTAASLFVESATLHRAFRDWLLGVVDECDPSRRGNGYLFEGHLWTAVHVDHYKVVSGVSAWMQWSDPANAQLRPRPEPRESGTPRHLPLKACLPPRAHHLPAGRPLLASPDVNSELRASPLDSPALSTSLDVHAELRATPLGSPALSTSLDVNAELRATPLTPPQCTQYGPFDYTFDVPPAVPLSAHIDYFRQTDWSQTPLGDMASWSPELRCVVNMTLNDSYPAILFWGNDAIMVYNEAYTQLLGVLHPCMGRSAHTHASDYWPTLTPLLDHINATGNSLREHDVPFFIDRHGFLEETYWSFQFTPVLNSKGHITCYYHHLFETTKHHLLERRVSSLVELGSQTANARTFQSFWDIALQALTLNSKDVPFALLYSTENQCSSDFGSISSPGVAVAHTLGDCVLKGSIGVESGHALAPPIIDIQDSSYVFHSYLLEAARLGKATIVHLADLNLPESQLANVDWQGYGEPCRVVVVCPIMPTTGDNAQVEGFLILGVNPRRPFDEHYQKFVHVMMRLMATSLASVALFDAEVRQKEKAIENAAMLQQQLLNEIQAKEKKFQSFAERSDVAIFICNALGQYTYRNRRWYVEQYDLHSWRSPDFSTGTRYSKWQLMSKTPAKLGYLLSSPKMSPNVRAFLANLLWRKYLSFSSSRPECYGRHHPSSSR